MIVQLKLPANERLQFLAGQYIEFILKDGARRSFSMANPPHDDEFLQIHVRHVPGGSFTEHVFKTMKERDILRFEGPLGSFFLHESEKPIVFVASGTGFAPIKAIIESAVQHGIERPMTLYWGARRPKDLYLDELARKWAAERPQQFKYVPVISDALPEDQWTGRNGLRPPRGDGGLRGPVRRPGLRVRRADHGRVGAPRLHPRAQAPDRRVLRRFVHHSGRSRSRLSVGRTA